MNIKVTRRACAIYALVLTVTKSQMDMDSLHQYYNQIFLYGITYDSHVNRNINTSNGSDKLIYTCILD